MPITTPARISKGRCKRLVALRNKKMIIRYYYWREIERLRSDDVFRKLSNDEFFLEEVTVRRIIRKQLDYFSVLKKEKPTEKRLQQLFRELQDTSGVDYNQLEMSF